MKKTILSFITASLLAVSMISTPSCIGSFDLTKRLLSWNKTIDNKFINEIVFFAFWVLPVYEVTALADILVLNSIEFWSGSNPLAKGNKIIDGNDGRYLVKCDGKGYDIISLNDGSKVRLDFNIEEQTWSYTINNETRLLFTFIDENHIALPIDSEGNQFKIVETSASGLSDYCFTTGIDGTRPAEWKCLM